MKASTGRPGRSRGMGAAHADGRDGQIGGQVGVETDDSRRNRIYLRRRGGRGNHPDPRADRVRKRHKLRSRGGRPPKFDKVDYRERPAAAGINRLKRHRAVVRRCDRLAVRYQATVLVAVLNEWLRPALIRYAPGRVAKEAGEPGAPQTSTSSSVIPSTGHASRLRRCSRVVSISLRKLLARMPVCDGYAHTDGFPFDPKD
ncbi:hypothetical protein [Streptomyces sp. NPDC058145]|uniref:hypothetical protein n=1 Tax=Streptomyces sp. NPDC058145 TaxID=3346356 RepID=UPI0036EDFA65